MSAPTVVESRIILTWQGRARKPNRRVFTFKGVPRNLKVHVEVVSQQETEFDIPFEVVASGAPQEFFEAVEREIRGAT